MSDDGLVRVASLEDLRAKANILVRVEGHTVALFAYGDRVYAVDNRCPHMGFPLQRGSVSDGILTCHWHHARFDLNSGGTFDQFADDVPTYPVILRGDEVWIDPTPRGAAETPYRRRLAVGIERDIPLVIAKSVLSMHDAVEPPVDPFRIGLDFAVQYRWSGWGQGATMLACMMNLLPSLDADDHPHALYHGLSAVARDSLGMAPRFSIDPLPGKGDGADPDTLKRWYRQFIEVRDAEGAERCVVSALRAGADKRQVADMLFAAATDHRYLQIGHVLDFTNKALESLDIAGWGAAETVLTSLCNATASADRMEESNAWRHPIDLVVLLEEAFVGMEAALEEGRDAYGTWDGEDELIEIVLDDDPATTIGVLLAALSCGATEVDVARSVTHAAALRIARFHTSNEFTDWDTALHTFTFSHAVHCGLRRAPSVELLRSVFDAAMSVYLDRFLNVPAARLPSPKDSADNIDELLKALDGLLDRQQQVSAAAELVVLHGRSGGDSERLMARLGALLLREDRDFHTIQTVEAAFAEHSLRPGSAAAEHMLIAAARYLAAHSPTNRAQGQTYEIARRFARGDALFEGDE